MLPYKSIYCLHMNTDREEVIKGYHTYCDFQATLPKQGNVT